MKNVVTSLVYGSGCSTSIPYNDSKVTQLLRHTLGGDCKTTILFHIHPDPCYYSSSLSTLRLATAATIVENTPSPMINPPHSLIREHLGQLEGLRRDREELLAEVRHFEERDEEGEETEQRGGDVSVSNEFISQSVIVERIRERHQEQLTQLNTKIRDAERKIADIEKLFLKNEPPSTKETE